MLEKSALADEGGGCTPTPFRPIIITYKVAVYAPAERTDTPPLFNLYPIGTLWFYTIDNFFYYMFNLQYLTCTGAGRQCDSVCHCKQPVSLASDGWRLCNGGKFTASIADISSKLTASVTRISVNVGKGESVNKQCQRHRWVVVDLLRVSKLSTMPAKNLPPMSTTLASNLEFMTNIFENFEMTLKWL
jgi:hypothetical protein